jgi:uncharacterized RDD family membrane protein YckC
VSAAWTTESSSAPWRGQTLGKRSLQLRVIDADGLRLTAAQLVARNLLRSVELPAAFDLVGGLFAAATRRAQRLGDIAAGFRSRMEFPLETADAIGDEPYVRVAIAYRSGPRAAARPRPSIRP